VPNSNEEEDYLKRYEEWRKEVELIAAEYHVPEGRLEGPNTSRGLLDVSAPTAQESKQNTDLVSLRLESLILSNARRWNTPIP